MYVVHGILGSGQNFRGLARQLVSARPDWGCVLVDLRMHGRSSDFAGPHTLEACARDLMELQARFDSPPAAVLGHSFGGKVAATYARLQPAPLERLWVLDSPLGERLDGSGSESTMRVLQTLERCPARLPDRKAFVQWLVDQGQPTAIAQWLAMNLRRVDDEVELAIDLSAIRELLDDYFRTDLWSWLEQTRVPTSLVLGERSEVWSDTQRARAEQIAASADHVQLRIVAEAAHWLHVDNPEGTLQAVLQDLP